ncbi:hypothetical protein [Sphingobium sp. EM0848]|uniref:hypothetical protein n=1 Tax=Sphingobium sp. EM0848 TaxID=2743473 RepID=UPI001C3F9F11|nr:hypothetical protein [Sphingobium sp. EM0848]
MLMSLLLVTASPALQANSTPTHPFTFERLESDYRWYADIRNTDAVLVRAVPPGTLFWNALDTLQNAGARCSGDNRDPRLARCTYSERIVLNDYYPADAVWTVLLHLEDGKAVNATISRDIDER